MIATIKENKDKAVELLIWSVENMDLCINNVLSLDTGIVS